MNVRSLFLAFGFIIAGAGSAAGQGSMPQAPAATLQLSMDQAVAMALETNLGLKADRLNTGIAAENVAMARAAFLPQIQSSFSQNTTASLPSTFTDASIPVVSSANSAVSLAIGQNLNSYLGSYSLTWSGTRGTTTANLPTFNPSLGSSLTVKFSQPLIRNFAIDNSRFTLQSAERTRRIADLTLESQITQTTSTVQQAYLGLIGATEQFKVAQENMDLAQENLRNFRARVKVGVSADIDVIQAEAQVASNEEQLVVAEAGIATAEDALRALIVDPARPDYWQVRLQPTDTITAEPRPVDVDAAIQTALANRLDLQTARRQLEIANLNLRLDENQVKPDLSFNLAYTAQGTGGTQFTNGSGVFPPPILSQTDRAFSSVVNDAFLGTYPSWTTGVTLNVPVGTSAAKATLAQDQLRQRQQDLGIENLELQVAAAVRGAGRDVQMNYKRVQATQKARQATERQLDAEQRKFAVGLATSFELEQFQGQLAQARINELNAMIDYNQSLITFERVQKIQ